MKKILFFLLLLAACNSEPSQNTKDLQVAAEMGKEEVALVEKYGTEDGRAKMELKYGEKKMRWYDSMMNVISGDFNKSDSLEKIKLDSIKEKNRK